MARRKDISDDSIARAKQWLEDGGTKKGACEILGVSNNKTMQARLDEFDNKIRIDKEIRSRKRREAVSNEELAGIIKDHLSGDSLQELSDSYYRSTDTIKHHLVKNGAFIFTHNKIDPLNPPLLPDDCVADSFEVGQYVWAAKYNCVAKVAAIFKNAYRIRVAGDGILEYSYQASSELGNLQHLADLGVDLSKLTPEVMTTEEISFQINKTLLEANKKGRKKYEDS